MYRFLVYPNHPELQIADANPARRRPGEKPNILAQLQRGLFNVHPGTPKGTIVMVRHTAWNHPNKLLKQVRMVRVAATKWSSWNIAFVSGPRIVSIFGYVGFIQVTWLVVKKTRNYDDLLEPQPVGEPLKEWFIWANFKTVPKMWMAVQRG